MAVYDYTAIDYVVDYFKLTNMSKLKLKSRFMTSIVGGVMLTLLTPTFLTAQDLRFGTSRVPRSCPSRSAPRTGAISVEQAKM